MGDSIDITIGHSKQDNAWLHQTVLTYKPDFKITTPITHSQGPQLRV